MEKPHGESPVNQEGHRVAPDGDARKPVHRKRRPMSTQSNKQSSNPTGAALYLRWLGILCAVMAAFCLGVFLIGYQGPSFGRIATLIALCIASPVCLWLSRRLS